MQCRKCQHFHRIKKFADAKVEYTAGGMTDKLLQHLSDKVLSQQCLPLERDAEEQRIRVKGSAVPFGLVVMCWCAIVGTVVGVLALSLRLAIK